MTVPTIAKKVDIVPVDSAWIARSIEEPLEPALPIVDPHHHLWQWPGNDYLFADLLADTRTGHNVVATVFVDCRSMYRKGAPSELRCIGETEFANGVAAMSASGLYGDLRACAAIVSHVDLRLGAKAGPVFDAQIAAGNGRFVGIRYQTAFDGDPGIHAARTKPTPGLMADRTWREGFAELARRGLTFDAWVYHPQIPEVADLAAAFPETPIVLDHIGGPLGYASYAGRHDEVFATWKASMAELARQPNVTVKLGGMGMPMGWIDFFRQPSPPSSQAMADAYRPWVETCIELFGADRCMFESNFPVDKVSSGYGVLWNAFKRLSAGASPAEKTALFSGTAARVYRIVL